MFFLIEAKGFELNRVSQDKINTENFCRNQPKEQNSEY